MLFAAALAFLSFWVIRQNSTRPGESLEIRNVVVSTEVDNRLHLTGAVSRFPYGTRQVCLRFDYGKAAKNSTIRIHWFLGEKRVQSDTYALSVPSGSKIYGLVRENGQPLPRGSYSISIISNEERLSEFRFEIY
jgi:hypothetical protein